MQLKIEYVPINELKVYENNAKIHTAEQIEQIKKSISEFGMNDPVGVWKDNVIIEGHGRLIALRELGAETVPIVRLDHLTDSQRKAYALAHNKPTMNTDFDMDILDLELGSIDDIDMGEFGFADPVDIDFQEFTGEGDGGGSVMMSGSKLRVVIGAFMCDIDEDQSELYKISQKLDEEKVKAFISLALKNGDLS